MSLQPGTTLGVYEIHASIGAGGIEFLIRVKPFLEKDRQPVV